MCRIGAGGESTFGSLDETSSFFGDFTDGNSDASITVEAIYNGTEVEGNNVALFEYTVAWYAMHDFIIDGHADAGGKAVVSLE